VRTPSPGDGREVQDVAQAPPPWPRGHDAPPPEGRFRGPRATRSATGPLGQTAADQSLWAELAPVIGNNVDLDVPGTNRTARIVGPTAGSPEGREELGLTWHETACPGLDLDKAASAESDRSTPSASSDPVKALTTPRHGPGHSGDSSIEYREFRHYCRPPSVPEEDPLGFADPYSSRNSSVRARKPFVDAGMKAVLRRSGWSKVGHSSDSSGTSTRVYPPEKLLTQSARNRLTGVLARAGWDKLTAIG